MILRTFASASAGICWLAAVKGLDGSVRHRTPRPRDPADVGGRQRASFASRLIYFGRPMPFNRMVSLYHASDCYLSPYLAEGFNMPALEAAACGLPLICTAGGPTDDFVTDAFAHRIRSQVSTVPQASSGLGGGSFRAASRRTASPATRPRCHRRSSVSNAGIGKSGAGPRGRAFHMETRRRQAAGSAAAAVRVKNVSPNSPGDSPGLRCADRLFRYACWTSQTQERGYYGVTMRLTELLIATLVQGSERVKITLLARLPGYTYPGSEHEPAPSFTVVVCVRRRARGGIACLGRRPWELAGPA